jgi:hypothetical protein
MRSVNSSSVAITAVSVSVSVSVADAVTDADADADADANANANDTTATTAVICFSKTRMVTKVRKKKYSSIAVIIPNTNDRPLMTFASKWFEPDQSRTTERHTWEWNEVEVLCARRASIIATILQAHLAETYSTIPHH